MRCGMWLGVILAVHSVAGVKLGFLGDSGVRTEAERVYEVMVAQNVDHIVQNGDFDYRHDAQEWRQFLDREWFGKGRSDVLMSSGNHDYQEWGGSDGYQKLLYSKLSQKMRQQCHGRPHETLESDYGLFMSCGVENVRIVMIGWSEMDNELNTAIDFINTEFEKSSEKWRVCVWHRPEGIYNNGHRHTGNYGSLPAYEACRKQGAMIVSGHSHVYGRTALMSSYVHETIASKAKDNVDLSCGKSFAVVSGMSGKGPDDDGEYASRSYWVNGYTTTQGDQNGALVCEFPSDAHSAATCEFYTTATRTGSVFESFKMTSSCGGSGSGPMPPANTPSPHNQPHTQSPHHQPPTPGSQTITLKVDNKASDVEERMYGEVNLGSVDLELAYYRGPQFVGIRWSGLDIPRGSTILNAHIVFTCHERGSGYPRLNIQLDDESDSDQFTHKQKPSLRQLTSHKVMWEPSTWTKGMQYTTPDLKELVQSVVNKFDWTRGNAVSAIITQEGSSMGDVRVAKAWRTGMGPVLKVTYATGSSIPTPPHNPHNTPSPHYVPMPPPTGGSGYTRTVRLQIARSEDDVEEAAETLFTDQPALDMPFDGEDNIVGLRFTGSGVPYGATIVRAYLEFTAGGEVADTEDAAMEPMESPKMVIYGDRAVWSEQWRECSLPSQRTLTQASTHWDNIPEWTIGSHYTTPDLAHIIQEITSMDGWAPANALSLMVFTAEPGAEPKRVGEAYDAMNGQAPRLVIQYRV